MQRFDAFRWRLAALVFGRFLLTTASRMVYPFLPELSRGLGVSIAQLARLLSFRSVISMFGPLLGTLSERFGRKPLLLAGIAIFSIGVGVIAIWPTFWVLAVGLGAAALAKTIYDPSMQAFIGDNVPYAQRGRAIAVSELSWSGALLVGTPVVGVIMARQSWQAPFGWLALLGVVGVGVLWVSIPRSDEQSRTRTSWRQMALAVRGHPRLWAAAMYALLLMAANEIVFVYYGEWLETSFQLNLTSLGLASIVIGAAELVGEVGVGWAGDRFGKRRVVLWMGAIAVLAYAALPYVGLSLLTALLAMFVLFLAFEMAFVGVLPIFTELMPQARSVALSVTSVALAVGRALGAFFAPTVAAWGGFEAAGWVAAGVTLAGVFVLWRWLEE
jgi:predicted MFS family arabinose efflux permease